MWIWVLSFTILGSNPEHGQIAKFDTKQECQIALVQLVAEEQSKGKQVVAKCFYSKREAKGWW